MIAKEETRQNGVKFVAYHTTKLHGGIQQSYTGVCNKVERGMQQSCTNNIDDKDINNLIDKDSGADQPATRPRFVKPTLEELTAYCKERGNRVNPERFLDYYNSNGWKVGRNPMKDWKATVRNWEKNDSHRSRAQTDPLDYGDPMDFYR